MGATSIPGGPGGQGGAIQVDGNGFITFRDVDLTTEADIESFRYSIFLSDGASHPYFGATGSLGGMGSVGSGNGGDGGAAGAIVINVSTTYPPFSSSTELAKIIGYGAPGGRINPLPSDLILDPVFTIGSVRQIVGPAGSNLYRLRLDTTGNLLAGGSGGVPGGSPLVVFPGRFGKQGAAASAPAH
jgi:hypothetical protein